ncbi:MAG: lipoprotein N-acyltransferase Lnb domain-containing protein [Candidatus Longimicrobiales bacterium M2_2A_002]
MRRWTLTAALVLALLGPTATHASPQEAPTAADSLRVFLVTFDQGAAVWERFGHNALWVHDPEAGTDIAYHWGLFDMSEEGFLVEFLQGRMFYYMGAADAPALIAAYRRVGRDATVQELALTVAEAAELQEFVRWNVRPENRRYRYDYFRDNCSTRVRDALDRALGGALHDALAARPTDWTYRSQAVTLTAEDALLTTGMDLGLGPLADQPITHWELAFIPMRLRDDVRVLTLSRDGKPRPLVVSERRLDAVGAGDPSPAGPTSPTGRALGHLLVGLLVGGVLAGAGAVVGGPGRGARAARWLLAALGGAWGLAAGLLGLILLGLWTLTDHEFAWRNENLLQTNPLALGLLVLVPLAVLTGRAVSAARTLALALLALSLLGLLIHPLPLTPQANLPIVALVLPIHLGLAYALGRVHRRDATVSPVAGNRVASGSGEAP